MRFLFAFVLLSLVLAVVSLVGADQIVGGSPIPSKTKINSTSSGAAGSVFNLTLTTFDALGNKAMCVDYSAWNVLFSFGVVNSTFVSCSNGVYLIDFYPQTAGSNSLSVSLYGVYVSSGPKPFTVYAGPLSFCSFLGSAGTSVGLNITLGLVCYDQFSNPLSSCAGSSSWSIYFSSYYTSYRYLVYQSCSVESSLSLEGLVEPQQVNTDDENSVQDLPVAVTYFGFGDVTKAYTYTVTATFNFLSIRVPSILFIAGGINLKNSMLSTSTSSTSGSVTFTPYDDFNNQINPVNLGNAFSFSACPNTSISALLYTSTYYVSVSYSLLNKPPSFCVSLSVLDENNQESVVGGTFKGEFCICELENELGEPLALSRRARASTSSDDAFQFEVELVALMVGLAVVGWLVGLVCGVIIRRSRQIVVEPSNKQTVVTF